MAAMSDTGSSLAQWAELYHDASAAHGDAGGGAVANGAAAAATSPASPAGSTGGSPTQAPGMEGPRVGKPARRRSRASRRAPVTLLNTDTTNFRAMVQQFTGIPAPPAGAFAGPGGVPVINFGSDYGFTGAVLPFSDHLQPRRPTFQDHLLRPQQQQQQQYTGAPFGYGYLQAGGAGTGDMFSHALSSTEDRLLLQSLQSAQMPTSAANHSANGYFA
uniref:VQ domain-containing protein n=1 Tax=Oryza meridionalis TaxID=40149 RepID=A0A0E0CB85_9ORYZ